MTQSLAAFIKDRTLFVRASETIQSITIYDVTGKLVRTFTPRESSHTFEGDFPYAEGMYVAKIKCSNGNTANIKLMN